MRPGKGRAGTGKEQCAISEWESNSGSTKQDSLDMHELYAGRWMRTYTVKTVTAILKRGKKTDHSMIL